MQRVKSLIALVAALAISALLFTVGLWVCSKLWAWSHTLTPTQMHGLTLAGILVGVFGAGFGVWRAKKRRNALAPE